MESFETETVVRSYHIYKDIWEAELQEELECQREAGNPSDHYAVAVVKDAVIVGHLPRQLARVSSLFLRRRHTL